MNEMNINDLTLDKLLELNELIVNRIKYLRDIESVRDKVLFNKGEFVSFEHNNRYVIGIVIKINIKTVSVKTEDGEVWRVSPSFLTKVIKANS